MGTLRLAAVVLRDNGNVYDDTRAMFDYVFENFSKVMLKEQTKPEEVRSYTEDDAMYSFRKESISRRWSTRSRSQMSGRRPGGSHFTMKARTWEARRDAYAGIYRRDDRLHEPDETGE